MITIFTLPENNRRLHYVASHFFRSILGADFQLTADIEYYQRQAGPCINYSTAPLKRGIQIRPHGLLAKSGIQPFLQYKLVKQYDPRTHPDFDPFAAAFYLLTLYTEYSPVMLDAHGRVDHRQSPLYQAGMLETPVVDRWAYQLKYALERAGYSTRDFNLRKYRVIDTYDIDHPYHYRYKGILKNTAGALRDLLQTHRVDLLQERLAALLQTREDPYMQALRFIHATQNDQPYHLFILLGKSGTHGHNHHYPPRDYYRYLKTLTGVTFGLHASYQTHGSRHSLRQLQAEKQQLEKILQRPIHHSRQHYLRMQTPVTFQRLQQAGILEDFTLAFAAVPGFRSGTAVPHYFYDLQREQQTKLLLRPIVVMDATFIHYQGFTQRLALRKIKSLIRACHQFGGDYLSLWHNSNLALSPHRDNLWLPVYIETRRYAQSLL
jgi:hypothetical protein